MPLSDFNKSNFHEQLSVELVAHNLAISPDKATDCKPVRMGSSDLNLSLMVLDGTVFYCALFSPT